MKGYTEVGKIKQSKKYQIKKLAEDMTQAEKTLLTSYLKENATKFKRSKHYKERGVDKHSITLEDIQSTLIEDSLESEIIEYNETESKGVLTQRVLIRINKVFSVYLNGSSQQTICFGFVVLNLSNNEVVTGYFNNITDRHETLRRKRYNNNLKVREIKAGGYSLSDKQDISSNEMFHTTK